MCTVESKSSSFIKKPVMLPFDYYYFYPNTSKVQEKPKPLTRKPDIDILRKNQCSGFYGFTLIEPNYNQTAPPYQLSVGQFGLREARFTTHLCCGCKMCSIPLFWLLTPGF
jgi:hypothetical protein